jgi:hypothetical protein
MDPAGLNTEIPHAARIYDYVLGGRDNFAVDRAVGDNMMAASPLLAPSMRANRQFMARAAAYLAEHGFKQYLDIGTGLPTHPNLHEIVETTVPDADIVYVDNDPMVLRHAQALLTKVPGATGKLEYLHGDLRDPDAVFAAPQVTRTLDLSRPVAVTMIAVLQLIDDSTARPVIADIMGRLAPGSALVLSTVVPQDDPDGVAQIVAAAKAGGLRLVPRTTDEVAALLTGLEIADPGIVAVHRWHPGPAELDIADSPVGMYGVLAYKR